MRRRDDLVYVQFNGRMIGKRKKYSSSSDVLLGESRLYISKKIRADRPSPSWFFIFRHLGL